jgi:hypothetical protein
MKQLLIKKAIESKDPLLLMQLADKPHLSLPRVVKADKIKPILNPSEEKKRLKA